METRGKGDPIPPSVKRDRESMTFRENINLHDLGDSTDPRDVGL